jgi:hypothetical protein
MKDIKVVLKSPVFVIGLEITGALAISVVLVLLVILPKYKSWRQARSENNESQKRIEKIDGNIAAIRSIDASEVESLYQKVATLLPEEGNQLRFFSLAEKIAASTGMKISAAQLEVSSAAQGAVSGSSTGASPSLSSGTGSSGTSPVVPQSAGQIKSVLTVKMSFEGSFPALLALLSDFGKGDQATQISSVSLSGDQSGGGQLTAAISFSLPAAIQAEPVSMESSVVLTQDTKKALQDLVAKIQFTSAPTNSPVGREDPFK